MKRLPAAFYELPSGREPVRDWLKGLDPAFVKKTQKTPAADLELAMKRKKEVT